MCARPNGVGREAHPFASKTRFFSKIGVSSLCACVLGENKIENETKQRNKKKSLFLRLFLCGVGVRPFVLFYKFTQEV